MSEQELLLLSNYVYMKASTDPMTIGESLDRFRNENGTFDEKSVAGAGIGGGMDAKQTADLFKRMDEMPDSFLDLYPSRIADDPSFRGICYTEGKSDGGSATVVFRGTGGTYDAWHDNVTGEYLNSTQIQKQAADFVKYDCASFQDLTVTGHSKGGNLAMYTTVVCAGAVAACVSFDGQGFSEAFIRENQAMIDAVKDRIKSVSAYNDFVNILLHPIAGERVFAQNQKDGIDAHSSYYLLASNEFDENGNLVTTRDQGFGAFALQEALLEITDRMDDLPGDGNRAVSGLLAAYLAAAMSEDKGDDFEKSRIVSGYEGIGAYLLSLLPASRRMVGNEAVIHTLQKEVQTQNLAEAASTFADAGARMRTISARINECSAGVDPSERIGHYVNQQLAALKEKMESRVQFMDSYATALRRISDLYLRKEQDLSALILTGRD
ncbi:MAG: DUF2974 domain-containing protein [Lachnospiraceae bacterium]|nr:DUF2974 domain-containing protein [Lachnospiraceae bacterium]